MFEEQVFLRYSENSEKPRSPRPFGKVEFSRMNVAYRLPGFPTDGWGILIEQLLQRRDRSSSHRMHPW